MAEYTEDLCTNPSNASASHVYSGRAASRAFDDQNSTYIGGHVWTAQQEFPIWLKYDFGETDHKAIQKYTLTNEESISYYDYNVPYSWEFQGSNDDINWTILDIQNDINNWSRAETKEFIFINNQVYRYYRWYFTSGAHSNGALTIDEAEMMERAITEINPNRPDLVNKLYNTKKTRLRGKAKEGFVRPTISQFLTSRLPRWSPVPSFTPPSTIGEFVEGGYYFGTIEVSGTTYYLVAAPTPVGVNDPKYRWQSPGMLTANPGARSLVDGYTNTQTMVATNYAPAANFCNSLTIGGYSDWYLPAKNELTLLYNNHTTLESAGAGMFINDRYYSSTEVDVDFVWYFHFNWGSAITTGKSNLNYVRAIRRFAA